MNDTKNQGLDNPPGEKPGASIRTQHATVPEDQRAVISTNGDPQEDTKRLPPPTDEPATSDDVHRPPSPGRTWAKPNRRVIHVYVSPEQYAEITARSARRGLAISEYMRVRALRGAIPSAYLLRSVLDQKAHDDLTNSLRILDIAGHRLRDHDGNITDEDIQALLDELQAATAAIHDLTQALQQKKS